MQGFFRLAISIFVFKFKYQEVPTNKFVHITDSIIELYKTIDRRYVVFLVFVLISAFLWLLNALSERYTTIISHPVLYKNMPSDKILVNDLPSELDLRVSAHGFDLLQELITRSANPISIDVRKYIHSGNIDKHGGHKFFILTEQGSYDIISQMGKDILVENIEPDSIVFTFSGIVDKKVPVEPNLELSYRRQYQQMKPLRVFPDSVTISGPAVIIDTINKLRTVDLSLDDLNATTQRSLALQPIENVSFSSKRVKVEVYVEQFTEGRLSVPIKLVNVPDDVDVQLLQANCDIRYVCGMSVFNDVRPEQFSVTVDVESLVKEMPEKAKLELYSYPASMNYVRPEQSEVEYYLMQKK